MGTVLVQVPGDPIPSGRHTGPRAVHDLSPGDEISFGRGSSTRPVDVEFGHPEVSRLAGRVRAQADFWLLSNHSQDQAYVVENPEGGGEHLKIAPRRLEMPVPFEFSRVVLPAGRGRVAFLVFAPQHTYSDALAPSVVAGDGTVSAFPLDESAKYFLVLVALCTPRLRDGACAKIPSVPDVVRRLSRIPSCRDITRRAVAFHIDYLARTKLRVREPNSVDSCTRAYWQRAALVSVALRFDLVRHEHELLLEPSAASAP